LVLQFPGRQLIIVSKKWGFTKYDRSDYETLREKGLLTPDGVGVKVGWFLLPPSLPCPLLTFERGNAIMFGGDLFVDLRRSSRVLRRRDEILEVVLHLQ